MAAPALCLVALFALLSGVKGSPQDFFYRAAYQQAYQPAFQQAYQPVYQQAYSAYRPPLLPVPSYIPAVPTYPIYSGPPRALLQGYSYETQDISGGHGQVIYVAGPDSQKIFLENAKALHFALQALPAIPLTPSPQGDSNSLAPQSPSPSTSSANETNEEAPGSETNEEAPVNETNENSLVPQVYLRAQVLPPNSIFVGSIPMPLFTYSVQTKPNKSKGMKPKTSTTTTEKPTSQKDEVDITTLAPSPAETNSSTTDATSTAESDESDTAKEEDSTDVPETSTENSDS